MTAMIVNIWLLYNLYIGRIILFYILRSIDQNDILQYDTYRSQNIVKQTALYMIPKLSYKDQNIDFYGSYGN